MFGAKARERACVANMDPPKVEREEQLLQELRNKVGPFSDEKRLVHHIRAARGKLFWAVNSYFRDVLMSVAPGQLEDFEAPLQVNMLLPHSRTMDGYSQHGLLPSGPNAAATPDVHLRNSIITGLGRSNPTGAGAGPRCQSSMDTSTETIPRLGLATDQPAALTLALAEPSCSMDVTLSGEQVNTSGVCSQGSLDCFPVTILEEILGHVPASTLCQAAQVSTAFRKAAASDSLWEHLFKKKWGDAIFPTEPHLMMQAVGHHSTAHHFPLPHHQHVLDHLHHPQQQHHDQEAGAQPPHALSLQHQAGEGMMSWSREETHALETGRTIEPPRAIMLVDGNSSTSLSETSLPSAPHLEGGWGRQGAHQRNTPEAGPASAQGLQLHLNQTLPIQPVPTQPAEAGTNRGRPRTPSSQHARTECGTSNARGHNLLVSSDSATMLEALTARTVVQGPPTSSVGHVLEAGVSQSRGRKLWPSSQGEPKPEHSAMEEAATEFLPHSLGEPSTPAEGVTRPESLSPQADIPPGAQMKISGQANASDTFQADRQSAFNVAAHEHPSTSRAPSSMCSPSQPALLPLPSPAKQPMASPSARASPTLRLSHAALVADGGYHNRHPSTSTGAGAFSEMGEPLSPTSSVMSCGFATDSEYSLPAGPPSSSTSLVSWHLNLPQAGPSSTTSLVSWQLPLPLAGPPSSRSISRASSMSGVLAPCPAPPQPMTWRARYRHQSGYIRQMRCPRCGGGRVVPIVYGFPSPAFLEGMRSKRLILGGDHLIENCHVWACTKCNSSYRTYPYESVELWQAELQLLSNRPSGSNPGGLPSYTYEL